MTRATLTITSLLPLLGLALPAAAAPPCVRTCPGGTPRDAHGCCLLKKNKKPPRKARPQKAAPRKPAGARAARGALQWVRLEGGRFVMGGRGVGLEGRHDQGVEVRLSSFSITRSEVTVAQYRRCKKAGACSAPSTVFETCNWELEGREDHPLNCVDWKQASAFCTWAGGRLPTEAQWEYAARSRGKPNLYPWGADEPSCGKTVMHGRRKGCADSRQGTLPACSRPRGATAQGLCDMAGNLREWVADWWEKGYHMPAGSKDPTGPDAGKLRVVRGSDWTEAQQRLFATTFRYRVIPNKRYYWLGFRCAR
jgi:formylglycine-generating enzyme required for sulfatase activity